MAPEEFNSRLHKVFDGKNAPDRILLMNTDNSDPNFFYLTGFTSGLFEYSYLVADKSSAKLFTSALEYDTALSQKVKGLEIIKIEDIKKFRAEMKSLLNNSVIGINEWFMPYAIYSSIQKRYKPKKTLDVTKQLTDARLVKSISEVKTIRKAVGITKWAQVLIQKEFKEGMTELQLAAKFDSISASLGSEEPSFKTIVCFGANAALPHHSPDNTKLKYGDFILIDAGAKVNNYCSDITRTTLFGTDKSKIPDYDKKQEMLKIVKDAQLAAIRRIRPGVTGSSIHETAQRIIDTSAGGKYKGTFIHALGHSLGIEVHDGPGFSPGARQLLKPGMVITDEPGIYVEGFGGVRIEDDILVTEKGAEVL